ncbi:hypothetical protein EGW08_013155 [Elysia chlorotica]|uniref:DRBM domain-containing protein n=1 Tax=Elysia chlorotica TaxID=188477 RepID=A0A3S1B3M9_ELYCH|nr:hypothetical protein EGW08_013155 [Elysia chlorotica]
MAAYPYQVPPSTAYDPSGQQFSSWSAQAADWAAQHQAGPQQYSPYPPAPATSGQYTGQQAYNPQAGPATYAAGYDYSSVGYVGQGYVGQASSAGDQYTGASQPYGATPQYGYTAPPPSWGGEQQWGWDNQTTQANGQPTGKDAAHVPVRGRGGGGQPGRGGGPPAFGSGRGSGRGAGPPAFGNGRGGGPPAFGSGRGGGPPALGSGRGGGPSALSSGRGGGTPASSSGRGGGAPAFGSCRGSGDRGRGASGDAGRGRGFAADRGRGAGGNRGKSFDRNGSGGFGRSDDKGSGAMSKPPLAPSRRGRGDGGQGRGRGGNATGSSNRGRGAGGRGGFSFGDRGRGARGGATSTRGGGRGWMTGNTPSNESVTVADTGVGLSSIGDLIKSAQQRRLQDATKGLSPDAPLSDFVGRWKTFSRDFVDCGNPISNLECSLKASKLDLLQLRSETDLLSKVSNSYNIFTSTLILVKKFAPLDHRDQESIFLARGLGLNKKAAKADCYQKAHKLLMESTVNDIMNQVDTDEPTLRQEIQILHRENPKGFMDLLKKTTETADDMEVIPQRQGMQAAQQVPKRKAGGGPAEHSSAKRPRNLPDDYLENQSSLAPKKKQGILMQRSAPLTAKLTKLKELLKEEGITKLHIVPKIDQFAHKTAITIRNVYKFIDIPPIGYEHKTPLYCEIYFDDVWVASSEPNLKRTGAMHEAYCNFTDILCTEPTDLIASNPRRWSVAMESMPDVCAVYTKWQGEDNDSLLTSNLANMKQMMHSMPQLKFPINKMVLTEHETDKNIENIFKSLELSATRNLVLLECEMLRNPDNTFTCNISLQGKVMASRVHSVKNIAKRIASEAVMNQLKKTNDFIYVTAEYVGATYTKETLFEKAREKKAAGVDVPKYLQNIEGRVLVKKVPEGLGPDAFKRFEEDAATNASIEELPENKVLRPLLPYLAMTVYDIIDKYYETLSLEDIIFDVRGMARSQREVIGMCANRMGMRINTKVRNMDQSSLLRRCTSASDMSKILQIHGGTSGRYKLTKCHNPLSKEELDAFKEEYLAIYQSFKSTRDFEEEEETVVKREAPPPQIPPTNMKAGPPSQKPAVPAKVQATPKPAVPSNAKKPTPDPAVSAWENDEPLDFKGPAGAGRGGPRGPRPAGPVGVRGPRPLMAGPGGPHGQRPHRPPPPRQGGPPPRHGAPPRHHLGPRQAHPQPLMQSRMAHPGPRMGGHFQY